MSARVGYDYDPAFAPFHPPIAEPKSEALYYRPDTRDDFRFSGRTTAPYQRHFARKLAALD